MIWITMLEIIGAAQKAQVSQDSVAQKPERAVPRPSARNAEEGTEMPWWRRMFG
jgi:hypothetical protein